MLVRLALETRQHHAEADSDRLSMMEIRATSEYREALARIYGFEVAVEIAVDRLPEPDRTFLAARGKRAQLTRDLVALGVSELAVEQLALTSVRVTTLAQGLAWMFVIERHTLLAGLLARHLERTSAPWANACAYLNMYAESTGSQFRAFGETLCEHVKRGTATPQALVTAASEAFRCQRLWYGTSPLFQQLRHRLEDPAKPRVIDASPETPVRTPSSEPAASSHVESQDLA